MKHICKRSMSSEISIFNKREKVGLNHCGDPKAFIEYSDVMQDVYKNGEEYNLVKKRKVFNSF